MNSHSKTDQTTNSNQHFSEMEIEMNSKNIKAKGQMTPWIRFCIGTAILFLAVTPLVIAIRWW